MSVDKKLHESTKYAEPNLRKKIDEQIDRIGSFVIDCNEDNWDSYGAKKLELDTIKFSAKVMESIGEWFIKNIGFLNNRSLEFFACPTNKGGVSIEMDYNNNFIIECDVKLDKSISCFARPNYRLELDGTKTLADRNFDMIFSKNTLEKNCDINNLHTFLDFVFYEHKWQW